MKHCYLNAPNDSHWLPRFTCWTAELLYLFSENVKWQNESGRLSSVFSVTFLRKYLRAKTFHKPNERPTFGEVGAPLVFSVSGRNVAVCLPYLSVQKMRRPPPLHHHHHPPLLMALIIIIISQSRLRADWKVFPALFYILFVTFFTLFIGFCKSMPLCHQSIYKKSKPVYTFIKRQYKKVQIDIITHWEAYTN